MTPPSLQAAVDKVAALEASRDKADIARCWSWRLGLPWPPGLLIGEQLHRAAVESA